MGKIDLAFDAGWNCALEAVLRTIRDEADDTVWLNKLVTMHDAVEALKLETTAELITVQKPSPVKAGIPSSAEGVVSESGVNGTG